MLKHLTIVCVFVVLFIALMMVVTRAQSGGAKVVSACGTLPQVYAAGTTRQMTVNTNGRLCI